MTRASNWLAVLLVVTVLTRHWMPLGVEKGLVRNLMFAGGIIGGLLAFVYAYQHYYGVILRSTVGGCRSVRYVVVPSGRRKPLVPTG